jgi:predicted AlkP superfamily pyrophosphatase or phosphodiesterase
MLALEPCGRVCLLVIDGLGWELLRSNADAAPFLNTLALEPLTTGFPATTAASLASLSTGLPPGEHGLLGYTLALPGFDRAFNALTWSLYGLGPRVELTDEVAPEAFQPARTLAEQSADSGLTIDYVGPAFHAGSGLSRAIRRAERFHAADSLSSLVDSTLSLLRRHSVFVFAYHPGLDAAGHIHGVASQQWHDQLVASDNAVRVLAEQLQQETLLLVTGDHGMVDLRLEERLDLADYPELAAGVSLLAGEARARYVRTVPGAMEDVLMTWRAILGDRMWVWSAEEAISTGLFGPQVSDQARNRVGDIVAAAFDRVGVVQREVDPAQARLKGHHGSVTAPEQLVPLLVYRG